MDGTNLPETRSTCPYCGVGCGVLLRPDGQGGLDVRGDPEHPANYGRLCSKGLALGETVGREGRLLSPRVDGKDTGWDATLDLVAGRFKETIAAHGPDSVALYVSGQLLTEDYYVANKLMKGFIGSGNIDTNSRLCMASTVAGHKRAFGTDTVPGTYEDLEEADLIVLVGSNLAWCHPVLYQRISTAKAARPEMRVVVVDPRRTATCDLADLHLPIRIGSDVALFNGLLAAIEQAGCIDAAFAEHVTGLSEALAAAKGDDPVATGLDAALLEQFYDMWTGTEKVVSVFSQGVNQSTSGVDKVNAILNCHLATGRIGRPGMGPLSVTGQPNAMGGREVGGLANMLACHLDIENAAHRKAVGDFWQAPNVTETQGLKAVDMFRAVADGRIKALWVIHTNPAVTLPEVNAVRAAIKGCDFVVVSDITAATDTARLAHVLLPASGWGEKDGTVTNTDRTISRQRPVLDAPEQALADWKILAEVGQRMGWHSAFDYESPGEIFREHAALSGIAGNFGKDFDISGLAHLSDQDYETLAPVRWPVSAVKKGGRYFADGVFFTPDGKGCMVPVRSEPPAASVSEAAPLRLNTGRARDQWHTMTRTGLSPRLSGHLAEPYLEIHPRDAKAYGIGANDLIAVSSGDGKAILRAVLTERVQTGDVFAPIHWTGETAPAARIDALVPGATDPMSGQPESKAAVVSAARYDASWYAYAVSGKDFAPRSEYWAKVLTYAGVRVELADVTEPDDWEVYARALFDLPNARIQTVQDLSRRIVRLAFWENETLLAAFFAGPEPIALMRDHLSSLPGTDARHVLTGRSPADQPDPGPIICSCFSVGVNMILGAIESGEALDVDAVGRVLQAGTNCGSCRPEIAGLIEAARVREAAE